MTEERAALQRCLDAHRRHVLGAIEGLSDEQLRRPALPSGWHCLGMVRHLALDERYWFRSVVGGEPVDFPDGPNADWEVFPGESAEDIFDLYRNEIERSNALIAATPIDVAPRQKDPVWEEWGMDFPDLRSIMLHMISETACHAGHVDAARELLDGRQWIVLWPEEQQ